MIRNWLNCDGERVGDFYPGADTRLDYGGELDYPTIIGEDSPKLNRLTYMLPLSVTIPILHPFVLLGRLFNVVLVMMILVPPEVSQWILIPQVGHFLFSGRGKAIGRGKGGKPPSVLAAIRRENGVAPCTLLRRDHVMDNHRMLM